MRALVQRVSRASVTVDDRLVGAIGPGLLVLLGISREDDAAAADRLADRVRALRVFDDAEGRMNEALGEREILCVSQFTLYGETRRGNRPSFAAAAPARRLSRCTCASARGPAPSAACSVRGWRSSWSTTVP